MYSVDFIIFVGKSFDSVIMIEFKKIGEGDIVESFTMFDPQKNDVKTLPKESGNYMILTRSVEDLNSKLLVGKSIEPQTIRIDGCDHYVVYVGQTQGVGLRRRYRHHFTEKWSEHSTFRRELGRRMGFELTGRKFLSKEEELTRFIKENFLFYYFVNKSVEEQIVDLYRPPLNYCLKDKG